LKRAKPKKKKVGRPAGRRPVLALRIDQSLYDDLSNLSAKSGNTLAEETVRRIGKSFADEEIVGGPDMHRLSLLMATRFWLEASQYAVQHGHPDWTPSEWLRDQNCYRAGALAVAAALIEGLPQPTPDEMISTIQVLNSRIANRLVDAGALKVVLKEESK
jgi:hypothetical protein